MTTVAFRCRDWLLIFWLSLWQEEGPARVDSDDDAATDVFLDDWGSGTGVVPLFALLWVLDWGGWPLFYWLNWEISFVQKLLLE